MEHFVCIHGHFYQPPRENPWLEAIELQDSAYPYHDWNERITMECYAPNTASRILDDAQRITTIVDNYSKISYNFGPTLLSWLQSKVPEIYQMILQSDRTSQASYSGHGSALAQAYNHMILPLANGRDKQTQVIWGIRDFEHRFGRRPEGLWLPETAVDIASLEALAAQGIKFTILAPHQASRVRKIGSRQWRNVHGARIDPSMPYEIRLPSGRRMALYFYDGPISRAVAFEGLLDNGEVFAQRLLSGFSAERTWPQLVHIATDGESYGHHHSHGDMALAYTLQSLEANGAVRLTNYGEFLEKFPPTHEVEIIGNTSWSCAHGIERWRSDCGCNSGGHAGWNQAWRGPLRVAFDWLRNTLTEKYAERAARYLADPWVARDDYVAVILDRSSANVNQFLDSHSERSLNDVEKIEVLKLLEMQRQAMLMYTSCGWFFDELSGIETVQCLQYAGGATQLAQQIFGDHIESDFLAKLELAPSNIPENRNGAVIFEKYVRPAKVDLKKVAAHYAVTSLFERYAPNARIYCYNVDRRYHRTLKSGHSQVVVGTARVTSQITRDAATLSFAVVHFGDHNISGGVRDYRGPKEFEPMTREILAAFSHADVPQVIRLLDQHFGGAIYSLRSLFRDEQRKILTPIVTATLAEAEAEYRQIYAHHALLMRFLIDLGTPLPKSFQTAAEVVLNADLGRAFQANTLDLDRIASLLDETRGWSIDIDSTGLGHSFQIAIERLAERLSNSPRDDSLLRRLERAVTLVTASPLRVDLWQVQNIYDALRKTIYSDRRARAENVDIAARDWIERFESLGDRLGIAPLEWATAEPAPETPELVSTLQQCNRELSQNGGKG